MNKQTAQLLEQHFDTAFAASDGIAKLRELILTLAMQGHLVEQDVNDPPASELLKEIEAEKERVSHEGMKTRRGKEKKLPPVKAEEVPYELPLGWEWVRLANLVDIQTGKKDVNQGHKDGLYPFFSCAAEPLKSNEYSFDCEALLLPGNGANVGLVTFFKGKFEAYQRTYVVNNFLNCSPQYIEQVVKARFLKTLEGKQFGSAINYIKLGNLTEFLIPLPPLPEQHRIVARIDQLMACCDALEKLRKEREEKRLAVHAAAIKQLLDAPDGSAWDFIQKHFGELYTVKENVAELRKAILQLAVMGRLVPQDPNDPPASELLKEIEAEKQRLVKAGKIKKPKLLPPIKPEEVPYELPQGWEWVRLGEIVSLLGDGIHGTPTYDETGEYFFINGNNLSDGVIEIKENTKRVSITEYEKRKKELTDRTVLVSINGTIGNVAFYGGEPVMLGKSACYLNLFTQIEKHYIKKLINSSYFLEYAFKSATGSTIKNVSLKAMREFCIPLPPLPEQHRIVARIDQLMALCDILDQQIDAATGKQTELLNAVMAQV
jgi:type I restriction enzyme S subunit